MKINIRAFAVSCGVLWAIGFFVLVWWSILTNDASGLVRFFSHYYLGTSLSLAGSLIGAVWAFADAFIGAALFIWLYNKLLVKFKE